MTTLIASTKIMQDGGSCDESCIMAAPTSGWQSSIFSIFSLDHSKTLPEHPNVIRHYCNIEIFSKYDDKDCLGWITIMELCDDKNLRQRLCEPDTTLDIGRRINIAIDVIKGLDHLESKNMKHFDIKPENICFLGNKAKLIDFGIVTQSSNQENCRKMGYTRRGTKYLDEDHLCKFVYILLDI